MQITRREFNKGSVVLTLPLALLGSSALSRLGGVALAEDKVDTAELMKPEALPDMTWAPTRRR